MVRSARSYHEEAEQLRAQGRTYRQIVAEWRTRHGLNSRVAFRLAHGLTQAEVARRWNEQWPDPDCPRSGKHISYWEIWPGPAGRAPSYDTLNRLAFIYQCSAGDLVDGEDHSGRDQVPQPRGVSAFGLADDPPSAAGSGPSAVSPAHKIGAITSQVLDDFETLTDTYRRMDYRDGSQRIAGDVNLHLRRLMEVSSRPAPVPAQRRLLGAAGDAAQLAAWLAIDGQHYKQATRFCRIAVSVAERSHDPALEAYSLGVLSYVHLHAGDGRAALDLLCRAQDLAKRGAPAAVSSWLLEAAGEAYGLVDDSSAGLAALAEAERHFDRVSNEGSPVWLGFYDAECHAARLKGRCLLRLGQPKQATRALYEALALLPNSFVRERSGTLIDLATAYIQLGQVEQACDAAVQADRLARHTGSERNRKRLRELLLGLLPWTDQECVKGLYHQVLLD